MNVARCLNVVVLHDDPLVAAGLRSVLDRCVDMTLVDAEALPTRADIEALATRADVALADYDSALALLAAARRGTSPRVLVVSTRAREHEVRHALRRGVDGYLVQGGELGELTAAIGTIARGGRYVGTVAAQRLADAYAQEDLTGREHEVLRELVAGRVNKSIAARLGISIGTVKAHVRAIFEKLGVHNRTQAAAVAERRGLLTVDAPRGAAPARVAPPPRPPSPSPSHVVHN